MRVAQGAFIAICAGVVVYAIARSVMARPGWRKVNGVWHDPWCLVSRYAADVSSGELFPWCTCPWRRSRVKAEDAG